MPARPCGDASVIKEAGRETVPESSHVSHFPWSCLSCCWLTDVVCSFQARISRVQLDLLQGESDNHIFFHSQQFDMDFVKWVCRNVSILLFSLVCLLFTPPLLISWQGLLSVNAAFFLSLTLRETCLQTIASASSTSDWLLNTSWAGLIGVTTPGRDSGLYTTTCLDPRGWVKEGKPGQRSYTEGGHFCFC